MIVSFIAKSSHFATNPLENYCTVNADWCAIICLPEAVDKWRKKNHKHEIIVQG